MSKIKSLFQNTITNILSLSMKFPITNEAGFFLKQGHLKVITLYTKSTQPILWASFVAFHDYAWHISSVVLPMLLQQVLLKHGYMASDTHWLIMNIPSLTSYNNFMVSVRFCTCVLRISNKYWVLWSSRSVRQLVVVITGGNGKWTIVLHTERPILCIVARSSTWDGLHSPIEKDYLW